MTHGAPQPGSRDNGLRASSYAPLADLDPRVAGAALERLRAAGIAAYAAPVAGERGWFLETRPPSSPSDRLYVDRTAIPAARSVLGDELGAPPEPVSDDAVWSSLVANLTAPQPEQASWPERENVPAPPPGTAAAGDEDHYVPPPPPPLPQVHPVTLWAWVAVLGGLGVLVVPAMFGSPVSAFVGALAAVALLGGFATLVYRMRDTPPTDSGPDDGAVV